MILIWIVVVVVVVVVVLVVVVVEQTYSDCSILLTLSLKLGGKFQIELVSCIYFISIKQIDYVGRNFY